jgi:hypothetical protein
MGKLLHYQTAHKFWMVNSATSNFIFWNISLFELSREHIKIFLFSSRTTRQRNRIRLASKIECVSDSVFHKYFPFFDGQSSPLL